MVFYGDIIDFVSYATLLIESMPSNADMFNFEVMTDAEGYYYIDLPAGYYVVTAYVEDESLSQDDVMVVYQQLDPEGDKTSEYLETFEDSPS